MAKFDTPPKPKGNANPLDGRRNKKFDFSTLDLRDSRASDPRKSRFYAEREVVREDKIDNQPAQRLAQEGELCKGWNLKLKKPFPDCDEGLHCAYNSGSRAPFGSENTCQAKPTRRLV